MENKNREAQFLNVPTMKSERQYGFVDASLVNSGWAIATWCFLTGASLPVWLISLQQLWQPLQETQ